MKRRRMRGGNIPAILGATYGLAKAIQPVTRITEALKNRGTDLESKPVIGPIIKAAKFFGLGYKGMRRKRGGQSLLEVMQKGTRRRRRARKVKMARPGSKMWFHPMLERGKNQGVAYGERRRRRARKSKKPGMQLANLLSKSIPKRGPRMRMADINGLGGARMYAPYAFSAPQPRMNFSLFPSSKMGQGAFYGLKV